MFNTGKWQEIIRLAYGYQNRCLKLDELILHYSQIDNKLGRYLVSPAYGDFVDLDEVQLELLDRYFMEKSDCFVRLKVRTDRVPKKTRLNVKLTGSIQEVKLDSYETWYHSTIGGKFRNQIRQGERNNLTIKISNTLVDLLSYWDMHAKLRINKFKEIPQPRKFFEILFLNYIESGNGFIILVENGAGHPIAGAVILLLGDTAYYKYASSDVAELKLRPNNYLIDRLVFYLVKKGYRKLNLGYTGSSEEYIGIRKYKRSIGAEERGLYVFTTPGFDNEISSKLGSTHQLIHKFIAGNPSLEEIDAFSSNYYGYFA